MSDPKFIRLEYLSRVKESKDHVYEILTELVRTDEITGAREWYIPNFLLKDGGRVEEVVLIFMKPDKNGVERQFKFVGNILDVAKLLDVKPRSQAGVQPRSKKANSKKD